MTLDSPSAVLVAFIAAIVTAAGWVITNLISRVREDRTRRLELTLSHIERQIEELYGPLLNLIVQIRATGAVQRRLLLEIEQKDRVSTSKSFRLQYLASLHVEMKNILSSKLHLVEEAVIPKRFEYYREQVLRNHLKNELFPGR